MPTSRSPDSIDSAACEPDASAHWPPARRLCAAILGNCPAPMLLVWGPQRQLLANAAYAALSGTATPGLPANADCAAALSAAEGGATLLLPALPLAFAGQAIRHADLHLTPLRDEHGQVAGVLLALAPAAAPALAAADGLRVLVVEDNLDAQFLLCDMLRAFGHHADGMADAEGALTLLAATAYDVLLTDLSLPGMSGLALARLALGRDPALHVVFASGYDDALLQQLDFPFQSLRKPFDIEHLQAALNACAPRARPATAPHHDPR